MSLERASLIARMAHAGQMYGTETYFAGHIIEVAYNTAFDAKSEPWYSEVAYLHDTLEDTELTPYDLETLGFDKRVIDAVEILTRPVSGLNYQDYIDSVIASGNKAAMVVKRADLKTNLAADGKPSLKPRYEKALKKINEALK
jgi:(p)ppGpp synthase/HD superfamily hydrolase